MYVPLWLLAPLLLVFAAAQAWLVLLLRGRNPLPFPDHGSRIFVTPAPQAREAVVELLARHGMGERFRVDSSGIQRSILWDGTIINYTPPSVLDRLGQAVAGIGVLVDDPEASAQAAAGFLRSRGFQARVVLDAEPRLPIAFVITNATHGTAINFRRHVRHLPRPRPLR